MNIEIQCNVLINQFLSLKGVLNSYTEEEYKEAVSCSLISVNFLLDYSVDYFDELSYYVNFWKLIKSNLQLKI